MARKTKYSGDERGAELTELLDSLETLLERTKVMYEQYFMGIQKIAPSQLHRDIERKIRELTQEQIRNTALRFRLTTLTQKFGSYNTYWRRTMQAIEQGRYVRDIARVQRRARRRGEDVPDELLVNMPKRIRDRIRRDRDQLAARQERERAEADEAMIHDELPAESDTDVDWDLDSMLDGLEAKGTAQAPSHVHHIEEDMLDTRVDELFDALTREAEQAISSSSSRSPSAARQARARATERAEERVRPPAARPGAGAQAGARPARSPSNTPPPPGMSEDDTRALYNQYIKARKLVGATEGVSYDRLKRRLQEQAPRIMKQYDARELRYDVVVKDDKVVVKASPKRE